MFFGSRSSDGNVPDASPHASVSHSPNIQNGNSDESVTCHIDPTIPHPDICLMAEAMPQLLAAGRSLLAEKDNMMKYYEVSASAPRYVCGSSSDNMPVLSHLYIDKHMVIDAGACGLMEKA